MDYTYNTQNSPTLDKFNKVKINYLNLNSVANNCHYDSTIINQNLIFSKDLIPLITSYFNSSPTIYGIVEYHYLDSILELKLPLSFNSNSTKYCLNHNLSTSESVFEHIRNTNKSTLKYYKKKLVQHSILPTKKIYYYLQETNPTIQVLKNYHSIEKKQIIKWELLPFLSLIISINIKDKYSKQSQTQPHSNCTGNGTGTGTDDTLYCQIYFMIHKRETTTLIDTHTTDINKIMKQFDKIISNPI